MRHALLCSLLCLSPLLPPQGRIVGYFAEWGIYQRNYPVSAIPADQLDVVNYAFAQIDSTFQVAVYDAWAAIQKPFPENDPALAFQGNFNALIQLKKKNPHLATMISIGGWTLSGRFSDAALTASSRATFSASAVAFMKQYGFDGIDIDWEYPVSGGLQNGRPVDKQNFTLLLRQVRADLDARGALDGRHYLLTIAAPAGPTTMANLELALVADTCDWVNLMSYDFHGGWETTTDHNAPLFGRYGRLSPGDPLCSHAAVDGWLAAGVASEKLVLGVAFYGRGWSGVSAGTTNGLRRPATGLPMGTWETGVFDAWDIAQRLTQQPSVYARFWDDVAKAPFVFAASLAGGTWIGYEDTQSLLAKVGYVHERRLGGVMFWELSGDIRTPASSLLTTIETALKPAPALRVDSRHLGQGLTTLTTLRLAHTSHANRWYALLGTLSGTTPGFTLGSLQVPLNWDPLTSALLGVANTPAFAGFVGKLDAKGKAVAKLTAPPLPGMLGLDLHFVYVQDGSIWDFASNSITLRVVR